MKRFICDHCGKELNGKDGYIDYEFNFEETYYECDLCDDCKNEITNEIDKRLTEFITVVYRNGKD